MKILAIFLFIVLVVAVVMLVASRISGMRRAAAPWQIEEKSDGRRVQLLLTKPGQNRPLYVGDPIHFNDPDFDTMIHQLRSEAEYKASALNHK